jgi:sugar/nucleoside kinase (ribokinase family)
MIERGPVDSPRREPCALFVGLCTFDLIQSVTRMPERNEKVTALEQTIAAGGPATNASVTFAFLGGRAILLTGIGNHPLAQGIHADLEQAGVGLVDAAEADEKPPAVSSIIVTRGTGDRSVVSLNASGRMLDSPPPLDDLAEKAGAVLIDGHHPALALAAARAARERGRLCILDGGSWKENTPELLPYVDIALCSADFRPPGVPTARDVLDSLLSSGISWAAVTDGARPITWGGQGMRSEIPVPVVDVADTLGAGDIFHGAFTSSIIKAGAVNADSVGSALRFGAEVSAHSCRTFGTRAWMNTWPARRQG